MIYKELINPEKTWLGRWLIGQSASCNTSVKNMDSEPQNTSKFRCGGMHLLFRHSFYEIRGRDRRRLELLQNRYPGLHNCETRDPISSKEEDKSQHP